MYLEVANKRFDCFVLRVQEPDKTLGKLRRLQLVQTQFVDRARELVFSTFIKDGEVISTS